MMPQRDDRQKALQWRAVLSIVIVFGWLIFLILWLFFYTSGLSIIQNLAVFLVSILILIAVLAVTWTTWGLKYGQAYVPQQAYGPYPARPRWKSVVSGIAGIIWLTFLVIWLFFYASNYTIYQNLGAILASALIVGGTAWALTQLGRP